MEETLNTNPKLPFKNGDYVHQMIEVRALDLEGQAGDMILEGRAVVFDEETILFKWAGRTYKEIIKKEAFDKTDFSQAFLKFNHDDSSVVARYSKGTLQLDVRDDGVWVRAKLANTTQGRDLYELVKRGDIDKMSFAFSDITQSITEDVENGIVTFTVTRIGKLWDVAAVTHPAYSSTELYARHLKDAEALASEKAEALRKHSEEEFELRKRKLLDLIG